MIDNDYVESDILGIENKNIKNSKKLVV